MITKDRYDGCNPEIAEALKAGKVVEVKKEEGGEMIVGCITDYTSMSRQYLVDWGGCYIQYEDFTDFEICEEKKLVPYVKSKEEIKEWLERNNYCEKVPNNWEHTLFLRWVPSMWDCCGEKPYDSRDWLPDWIEWREE